MLVSQDINILKKLISPCWSCTVYSCLTWLDIKTTILALHHTFINTFFNFITVRLQIKKSDLPKNIRIMSHILALARKTDNFVGNFFPRKTSTCIICSFDWYDYYISIWKYSTFLCLMHINCLLLICVFETPFPLKSKLNERYKHFYS